MFRSHPTSYVPLYALRRPSSLGARNGRFATWIPRLHRLASRSASLTGTKYLLTLSVPRLLGYSLGRPWMISSPKLPPGPIQYSGLASPSPLDHLTPHRHCFAPRLATVHAGGLFRLDIQSVTGEMCSPRGIYGILRVSRHIREDGPATGTVSASQSLSFQDSHDTRCRPDWIFPSPYTSRTQL